MRLTHTSIIAAIGFGSVWLAAMASCSDEDPDNLLTTVATNMSTTSGMGGTSTDGGGGAGADGGSEGGSGGAGAEGGMGGQGGQEPVLNGCTSATATDLTGGQGGAGPIEINIPSGGGFCIKVDDGAMIKFNHAAGGARIVHGTYEGNSKFPSIPAGCLMSPTANCPNWIFCNNAATMACGNGSAGDEPHYCPTSPYNCPDMPVTGPLNKAGAKFNFGGTAAFPWYEDLNQIGASAGVIYIE